MVSAVAADRSRSSTGVPSATSRPWSRIASRSQRSASSIRCVVTTTVTFRSSAERVRNFHRSIRAPGSRPVLGSSSSSTWGPCRSPLAISTRRCKSARELSRVRGGGRRAPSQPVTGRCAGQVVPRQSVEVPLMVQVFADGQLAVEAGGLERDADPARGPCGIGCTSRPQIEASAGWTGSSVVRMRNSVVLPPPLGPRRPKISPAGTSNDTPSSAGGRRRRDAGRGPQQMPSV